MSKRRMTVATVAASLLSAPFAQADTFHQGSFNLRSTGSCLSEAARAEIDVEIAHNTALLESRGLFENLPAEKVNSMIFPLQAAEGFTDYGFHYALSYVDHNHAFGTVEDYECGVRTADGATVGWHRGTDYNLWPFHWNKMDLQQVEVVAARSGFVVARTENEDDRSCPGNGLNSAGNAIYLRHADGSVAWYVHMKKGSVISRPVGSFIDAGTVLGIVGSSGSSVSPHLHFEIRDKNNNVIDPYAGPCNELNAQSWWVEQPPYLVPSALKVSTHSQEVRWSSCPNRDIIYESTEFQPGDDIWFYLFGRDAVDGQLIEYKVYDPDGIMYRSWNRTLTGPFQDNYFQGFDRKVPANAQTGTHRFEVTLAGQVFESYFNVGSSVPVLFQSTEAHRLGADVLVRWNVVTDESIRGFRLRRATDGQAPRVLAEPDRLTPQVASWLDRDVTAGQTYEYTLSVVRSDGTEVAAAPMKFTVPAAATALAPSYPNPFNPSTTIAFSLESRGPARIDVVDLAGRHLVTLTENTLPAGHHRVQWDGRDENNRRVASGVYLIRLRTGSVSFSRKVVLVE